MKSLQLRKKLFTIYYDVLSLKEQVAVLRKLKLTQSRLVADGAWLNEGRLCDYPVKDWIDAMKPFLGGLK